MVDAVAVGLDEVVRAVATRLDAVVRHLAGARRLRELLHLEPEEGDARQQVDGRLQIAQSLLAPRRKVVLRTQHTMTESGPVHTTFAMTRNGDVHEIHTAITCHVT